MFRHEEADRTMLPAWQAHTTGFRDWATPPPHARAWSKPLWWLRKAVSGLAVRMGFLDVGLRVHGSRSAVLALARGMTARDDIDVRPLDGRGRLGTVQHGENALHRGLTRIMGSWFATIVLVDLAQKAAPAGAAVCWLAALACTCVVWWNALGLPLANTRLRSAAISLALTALAMVVALGIPGWITGMTTMQAVVTAAVTYYTVGLVLLGRRWKWQVLIASVLPLIATLVVAALPLTDRLLHDVYADELDLTSAETEVSSIWQLAAAVKLLSLPLGAILFVAAGWGILRYFHFIRPRSVTAGVVATLILTLALITAASKTLNSPAAAADKLKHAATRGTPPPPYFGISPEWACVIPTVPAGRLTEEGGTLRRGVPYVSFGIADGQLVLWNGQAGKPLRIDADQVRVVPQRDGARECA
ncbi:hypothetical protein N4P33_03715 [Streptomyces sp. 15-116A]|uniref:hypothetical protein n=1 Tax=Streptomyces sp. 15-116A TaxID=2259035 RepID=UPI0021B388A1|nr:hypothetical protein [Streptomyces sp. 15-116A]MCT7351277.1 hypothetical protein [Streptomyces sp. 15-116A]